MTIFLDRDGTVIVDKNYLRSPDEVELLPNVGENLRKLIDLGHKLVLVTNQSGISRGFFEVSDMDAVHVRLKLLLEKYGVVFAGIYYCPHVPDDNCSCRKPKIGMALSAATDLGLDLSDACMVGDKDSDIEFGIAFGAKFCLYSIDELMHIIESKALR